MVTPKSGKVVKLNKAPYCELCGKQTWTSTIRDKSQAKESEEQRKIMQQKVQFFFPPKK
jgi:hypothetical protein